MNKKKIIYIVSAIVVFVLGYFNYFAKEGELKEVKKVIETKNAVYESDEYYVEAEKEFNYIDEKESKFEKAKAKIKGMLLQGDNVLLDKAKNLILKSNIIGISPNGWQINASELKYVKETNELISNEFVSAKNEKEGIEISGQVFKTNVSMDYIILENGVTIKNKLFSLSADSAKYSNDTKIVELEGNIKISGYDEKDAENNLKGNFKEVYYHINERNLYVNKGFDIEYEGIKLSGDKLVLNDRDETFLIEKNVKFAYQDYIFDVAKIEKKANSKFINIYGKIKGGNKVYNLVADSGLYDIETKKIFIQNNINVNSTNNEKLIADKIEYDLSTKEMEIYGKPFKYLSKTNNLEAEHIKYNTENKLVSIDKKFYAFNEKKESLNGTDLVYNLETKDFYAKNPLSLTYQKYELIGADITYNNENSLLEIPSDFEIREISSKNKILGNKLTYNKKTGELLSENELNFYFDTLKITGKNLTYNNISNLGKIEGPITLEDKINNISGVAKEIDLKIGDFIQLVGKIELKKDNTQIEIEDIKYRYSDEKIYVDDPIIFKDNLKKLEGQAQKAIYNPKTQILKLYSLNLKEPKRVLKAGEINYYTKDEKIEFVKNVLIKSEESTINTQNLIYYPKTEDIEIKVKNQIAYNEYLIKSDYLKFNNKTEDILARNINIISNTGNEFFALETKGNLNKGLIHFIGNVSANVINKNEKTIFEGEMLDLYLEKIANRKYKTKKLLINKNATFTQLNKKLESNLIEADLLENVVYIKNRPLLTINNPNKENTLVRADNVIAYLNTKELKLNGKIYVEDFNDKKEKITLVADRAIIKDNIASVYDNLKVTNKDSVLTANEGHYDINTKKIRLKGNVHMDYITEKRIKK